MPKAKVLKACETCEGWGVDIIGGTCDDCNGTGNVHWGMEHIGWWPYIKSDVLGRVGLWVLDSTISFDIGKYQITWYRKGSILRMLSKTHKYNGRLGIGPLRINPRSR